MGIKKVKSAWRRRYWDKLSFLGKVWHCIKVFLALVCIIAMWLVAAYVVLVIFGLQGFIHHVRDTIILNIMHSIFG
ncbi:MAG: hypothetical protein ACFFG0_00840 [Candidatus Thorarchaeota archaeon]